MFVYEKGNTLNITFSGSIPVKKPEVVLTGYKNGVSLTVIDEVVIPVADAVEFDGAAQKLVYQKDSSLKITFHGIAGMAAPEVTVDEVAPGVVTVVIGDASCTLNYTDTGVTVAEETSVEPANIPAEPQKEVEPTVEPEDEIPAEGDSEE